MPISSFNNKEDQKQNGSLLQQNGCVEKVCLSIFGFLTCKRIIQITMEAKKLQYIQERPNVCLTEPEMVIYLKEHCLEISK